MNGRPPNVARQGTLRPAVPDDHFSDPRQQTGEKIVAVSEVAYLGPEGTYSHLVAEKRFGRRCTLVPLPTIHDVCARVARDKTRRGIVPIENSSGGAIYETVDILLEGSPRVQIEAELTLDVKLALLGRPGENIRTLYSHFAPLEHCAGWIRQHLPDVVKQGTSSTAVAAQHVLNETQTAALGSRRLAKLYGLSVLQYPVHVDIPNITAFLSIGARPTAIRGRAKTTLAVKLLNEPGALCTFLATFREANVNLSRILSRPIRGCPREYIFLVDIEGAADRPEIKRVLTAARRAAAELRVVGSYPINREYKS